MDRNDITEVENDYTPEYYVDGYYDDEGNLEPYTSGWIAGTGDITHEIGGKTRELVLDKVGRPAGLVTVIESHRDGGYCVTCSFEYLVFIVQVDGETVYESGMDEAENPFGLLQAWLTKEG